MPKVHQAYHEGDLQDCQKSTCLEYLRVTKNWRKETEGE